MKIERLEAHDRYLHLIQDQSEEVQQGADDCLRRNPLSLAYQSRSHYIYIFGHARTADDGVNKRLIWQPRLSKPKAEPNSYLFRACTGKDVLEVCWVLPPLEYWSQFKKGNVVQSNDVSWSINQYYHNRQALERPFEDDYSDDKCKAILLEIAREMDEERRMKEMYATPKSSEVLPFSF
jgi:hypothetical protein